MPAGDVDGVILGAVEMMGEQAHPGTAIPFLAGFPPHVTGLSVERACTTAMMSVHVAAMSVQCGLGDVYIAGGLDSMTHFRIPMIKDGMDMDAIIKEGGHMLAAMNPNPKMMERINPIELNGGQGAELLCDRFGITRRDLDEWALLSHRRAVAAQESGPLRRRDRRRSRASTPEGEAARHRSRPGAARRHHAGEDRRPAADLPRRRPHHRRRGVRPGGRRGGVHGDVARRGEAPRHRAAGVDPHHRHRRLRSARPDLLGHPGHAPRASSAPASRMRDMEVVEINEAFACAPIALMREFEMPAGDAEKINVNGGACALGHPVGASGARLVGTLALEMRRRGSRYGLATICGGMGQGAATILERH